MNIRESDVLAALLRRPYEGQRSLAERSGHSLGAVNRALRSLIEEGYLDAQMHPTEKTGRMIADNAPRNAIILAAGYGMRMVPINMETPKGLLEVKGEVMIERTIRQLHEAGVTEIYIIVGFMKEQYEYLTDKYGVELIVNPEYARKNNLHSLAAALSHLSNTYVIPCDIWCGVNPFCRQELYSWYMVSDRADGESRMRVNRRRELVSVSREEKGSAMIGICYLLEEQAATVRERIAELCSDGRYDGAFWEEALCAKNGMLVPARVVRAEDFVEINTYEQLSELDGDSSHLKSEALQVIAQALDAPVGEITDISVLKKGMTNRSFLFTCRGEKYIMRIPGEGTQRLIDRRAEAAVYRAIDGRGICDDVVYLNPANGYKITRFLPDARVCDPDSEDDLRRCMQKLRAFHALGLEVGREFNIFGQIETYEALWNGAPSVFRDYGETKKRVLSLKPYIDAHAGKKVLTHIDAVPDNFLFVGDEVRLIDWEYAGMQDPHVDVAMFCIYSLYDREQIDRLIDIYFEGQCPEETRLKIYCYISACGLLWSNWCEYKRSLGVEFGEYSLRQYQYAKRYYKLAAEELSQRGEMTDAQG